MDPRTRAPISVDQPGSSRRTRRLEIRISAEQDQLVREAAQLEETTVSRFVLETVTERARHVVADHRDIVLSNQAFDRFITELDRPVEPVQELVELFRRQPSLDQG